MKAVIQIQRLQTPIPGAKSMEPRIGDAVLGGGQLLPAPGAMVLGTGRLYAKLFDRFNNEAKACNKHYLRLELSPSVALVRNRRAAPLTDIVIKVFWVQPEPLEMIKEADIASYWMEEAYYWNFSYWAFAGYLKHDGALFGHTAKYDPDRCNNLEIREIALQALREGGSK